VLALARRWVGFFPFFRAFVAMEFTLLVLAASIIGKDAEQVLVTALVPIAAITAAGHLLAIVTSARLR
jgi:hypothetical protein